MRQEFLLYNFSIMLKKLRFIALVVIGLAMFVGAVVFVTYENEQTRIKYQHECYEQRSTVQGDEPTEQNDSRSDECKEAKSYMPWWYVLVAWPEGITVWVVLATGFVIAWQAVLMRKHAGTFEELAEIAKNSNATAANTLEALKRQADTMDKQTEILGKSVEASNKSANAALTQIDTMKAKERARVWITIDGDLNLGMGPFAVPVAYVVTQTGPTDGFVLASFAALVVSDTEPEVPAHSNLDSIRIPGRLTPQFEKRVESAFLHRFTEGEIERINTKTASAYFIAWIRYNDIFGDPHETSIMKQWRITDLDNPPFPGKYGKFSYWNLCGPPEANHNT